METPFRRLLILVLALILGALARGMYFLLQDAGRIDRTRVVKALTARLILSFLLFVLLLGGRWRGLI